MSKLVYFVRAGGGIKIGWSTNVGKRIAAIATANPVPLELLFTVEGGAKLERALHRRLADHRLRNEWFRDCPEVREVLAAVRACGAAAVSAFLPEDVPVTPGVGAMAPLFACCRTLWPRRTAAEIAARAGVNVRAAERWLAGTREMSASKLIALLRSDVGPVLYGAITGGVGAGPERREAMR